MMELCLPPLDDDEQPVAEMASSNSANAKARILTG
jgi:hypothetical protein